jgi:hypothetical protein
MQMHDLKTAAHRRIAENELIVKNLKNNGSYRSTQQHTALRSGAPLASLIVPPPVEVGFVLLTPSFKLLQIYLEESS